MENILYNELWRRGLNVDVGVVAIKIRDAEGVQIRKQLEVDFVVNRPLHRYYIQSALHMPTPEKSGQERRAATPPPTSLMPALS